MYVFHVGMIVCAFSMFMSLCVVMCVDAVCVGRQFYWCLWCWSVRCIYVEECG